MLRKGELDAVYALLILELLRNRGDLLEQVVDLETNREMKMHKYTDNRSMSYSSLGLVSGGYSRPVIGGAGIAAMLERLAELHVEVAGAE